MIPCVCVRAGVRTCVRVCGCVGVCLGVGGWGVGVSHCERARVRACVCTCDEFEILHNNSLPRLMIIIIIMINVTILHFKHITHTLMISPSTGTRLVLYTCQMHVVT